MTTTDLIVVGGIIATLIGLGLLGGLKAFALGLVIFGSFGVLMAPLYMAIRS